MTELLEKIRSNPNVMFLRDMLGTMPRFGEAYLVGGAIVDILEGRTPKDYDFVALGTDKIKNLLDAGFAFVEDTANATTYARNDMTIQLLKTGYGNFDFTISQSRYGFRSDTLKIDERSFNNKVLVPVSYHPESAKNALLRIPHWKNKGYSISDRTYSSLVQAATNLQQNPDTQWNNIEVGS
jgi:hypothetical protein